MTSNRFAWRPFLVWVVYLVPAISHASLTRIEVLGNSPFVDGRPFGEAGTYVRITGRFHGELDPNLPANKGIVDLARAPRNARGKVEYSADFDILRPED